MKNFTKKSVISGQHLAFILRVQIKVLLIFRTSLDDYFWVWLYSGAFWEPSQTPIWSLFAKIVKGVSYFFRNIPSEIFGWVLNTPLIFELLRGKLNRSLFHDKINSQVNFSSRGICSLCNILSLLKVTFFVHFYFLRSLN